MSAEFINIFRRVKAASRRLAAMPDELRVEVLQKLADMIDASHDELLKANSLDLARMERTNPLYDRLQLTPDRLRSIAADMRHVASLPSPLGEVMEERVLDSGLKLRKVRVPFGAIGVIYEARPNVTFDVFSLCFRSGNACLLKGGRDAECSNLAIAALIKRALEECGADEASMALLSSSHEATAALLEATGYVDVCIPRGGRRLIEFVRDNARVPVIETGAGVVSAYFDSSADLDKGRLIVENAKTRRVSVCNALDTLLIHNSRLGDLGALVAPLAEKNVALYADECALSALSGVYPIELLHLASENTFATEWMDYKMGIRTVDSIDEAIEHIAHFGSGHSECIIAEDIDAIRRFQTEVDAACVYVNAPTSFTDGAQFGLGAEIGISTQKLGPRGPMGLREICTYKYLIEGNGQIRK